MSEDDTGLGSSVIGEASRVAGTFWCLGEDVERMARRTAWLSNQGLAVFAESHRLAAGPLPDVGHLDPTLFVDIKKYREAKAGGDEEAMVENKGYVWDKLRKVRTLTLSQYSVNLPFRSLPRAQRVSGSLWCTSSRRSIGPCSRYDGAIESSDSTTAWPRMAATTCGSSPLHSAFSRYVNSCTTAACMWSRGPG